MDFVGRPFVVRSFGLYCMELGRQRLLVAVVEHCFLLDRQHIVLFDIRLPNRSRKKIDKNVIKCVHYFIAMKIVYKLLLLLVAEQRHLHMVEQPPDKLPSMGFAGNMFWLYHTCDHSHNHMSHLAYQLLESIRKIRKKSNKLKIKLFTIALKYTGLRENKYFKY